MYFQLLFYGAEEASQEIMEDISNYMGDVFEGICQEYFMRKAKERMLPFIPYKIGKWWGNNPTIKAQDDVDILMIDKTGKKGIFVECKFTSKTMTYDEYVDLETAMLAFPNIEEKKMYFISKSGYSESVIEAAKKDGTVLLTLDDLFI